MPAPTVYPTPGQSSLQTRRGFRVHPFCDHYNFHFVTHHPCMLITHLTRCSQSSRSIHNYVLGIRVFHMELGLSSIALDSFQVTALLRAADISIIPPPPPVELRTHPSTPLTSPVYPHLQPWSTESFHMGVPDILFRLAQAEQSGACFGLILSPLQIHLQG